MTSSFDAPSGLHLPQPAAGEPSSVGPQPQPTGQPLPATSQQFDAGMSSAYNTVNQPQSAAASDQTDELDKEWISKAKSIVEQTKQDPFIQSKEIGKAKADYLRIRFNKHIKVGPDQTL